MAVEGDLPPAVKAAIVDATHAPPEENANQHSTLIPDLASASFDIGMSILDGAASGASAVCSTAVDVVGSVLGGIADGF